MSYNKVPFNSIVAYLRKSRADGDESVEEVLAKHERILQDYCVRTYGVELSQDKIMREVASGETIEARPVMQQLITMIQDGDVSGVLVVDLQRLSRGDLIDIGTLSMLFQITGCEIITPTRQYNLSDEYDKSFFEMEIMHGKDYLAYIKKIMIRGREQSVRDGYYIGSIAPYGYNKVMVNKKPALVINESEAAVVRMIYEWYCGDELLGPVKIAEKLNNLGIKPRKSEKWTQSSVDNIVDTPLYCGRLVWNARKLQKKYVNGKIVETRPRNENRIEVQGRHPTIISEETYNRAFEIMHSRAHIKVHKAQEMVNPLSGILRCECGMMMTYKIFYEAKTHAAKEPMLLCNNQKNCGCRSAYISTVLSSIKISLEEALPKYIELAQKAKSETTNTPLIDTIKEELAECDQKQEKLYDYFERGIYPEDVFVERTRKLQARKEELNAAIQKAKSASISAEQYNAFVADLKEAIDTIEDTNIPAKEKNTLLRKTIDYITYRRERSPRRKYDPTPIHVHVYFIM